MVRLHPTPGIRLLVDAQRSDSAEPEQINLDMEFAEQGGEGPTPYEVLLHAAMLGDSTRFTRQDNIEETWRICAPLIEKPPRVQPYKPGIMGPEGRRPAGQGLRRLARPLDRLVTPPRRRRSEETMPQSAAMPSPFPPIADYAFLSNCHTGALVAPDGAIDWLCVPRFDSPSIFGTLLDREAGSFRFGPFGINVPSARIYEPGTNILNTTWHTPTGWAFVRDALTIGPDRARGRDHPPHAAPADEDAHHLLVRTVLCMEGSVDMELLCEPDFDYGRTPAEWSLLDGTPHRRRERGRSRPSGSAAACRWGPRARSAQGAAHAAEGGAGLLLPLLGGGARLAGGHG